MTLCILLSTLQASLNSDFFHLWLWFCVFYVFSILLIFVHSNFNWCLFSFLVFDGPPPLFVFSFLILLSVFRFLTYLISINFFEFITRFNLACSSFATLQPCNFVTHSPLSCQLSFATCDCALRVFMLDNGILYRKHVFAYK